MGLLFEGITRNVTILVDESTDERFGKEPSKRSLNEKIDTGFVLVDKPSGMRSHTVSTIAKALLAPLGVKKAGYSGTLDPSVTGLLPITFNRANKVIAMLLLGGKEYVALMHLHGDVDAEKLAGTINRFKGRITQLPPVRSHVKRVYRQRTVYYLDVLEINGRDVLFKTGVESGTYIRKLIHDMGQDLGVGAHMAELRRTKVANLTEDSHLVTLQDIEDGMFFYLNENNGKFLDYAIQNIEDALDFLPKVWVSDSAVDPICNGSPLAAPGVVKYNDFKAGDKVFLSSLKGELIAIGNAAVDSSNLKRMEKGIVVKTDSVVMKPGTYPKYTKINSENKV